MVDRDDQKRQVQDSTDIVRLVGEQVSLKPRGKEFIGLCPFHEDHSPSMYVSPVKQIYKCFSCGAGGDVFAFVMNYHKMTFPEALKFLADRAGIELQPLKPSHGQGEASSEKQSDRKRIAAANAQAVSFYQALLRHPAHGKAAREYVASRGISQEMIEAFALGYAPDRWDGLVMTIASKKLDLKAFELAGLVSPRQQGPQQQGHGHYDKLRHRLIFPIFDSLGRPIAFGGRKMRAEDEPKYLNSPETQLFNKSATLYGLHLAKKTIIDTHTAIIVEGYTDVIACHQAGLRNVVATLGTALTPGHVSELRRYAQKVILVYDADEAGQKAADRAVEVFLTGSLDVAMASLPDGLDPADLLAREDGVAQWHEAMENATDALAFSLGRMQKQLQQTDTVTGREQLIEQYLRRLAQLGFGQTGAIRRSIILGRLSDMLNLSQDELAGQLRRLAPQPRREMHPRDNSRGENPGQMGRSYDGHDGDSHDFGHETLDRSQSASSIHDTPRAWGKALPCEAQLVGCLLREPALFHQPLADGRMLDESILPQDMNLSQVRELYAWLYDLLGHGQQTGQMSLRQIVSELVMQGRQDLADLATTLEHQVEAGLMDQDDRLVTMFIESSRNALRAYQQREDESTRQQLMNRLKQGGDVTMDQALLRQYTQQRLGRPSTIRIAKLPPGT